MWFCPGFWSSTCFTPGTKQQYRPATLYSLSTFLSTAFKSFPHSQFFYLQHSNLFITLNFSIHNILIFSFITLNSSTFNILNFSIYNILIFSFHHPQFFYLQHSNLFTILNFSIYSLRMFSLHHPKSQQWCTSCPVVKSVEARSSHHHKPTIKSK